MAGESGAHRRSMALAAIIWHGAHGAGVNSWPAYKQRPLQHAESVSAGVASLAWRMASSAIITQLAGVSAHGIKAAASLHTSQRSCISAGGGAQRGMQHGIWHPSSAYRQCNNIENIQRVA